ncbi:DmsC/YnfH family molybdoenzyme membrane anchor subunit [Cronobacter sakazakii]|uniref:DmsC/YnfH family molybdoenzyme membrane anchor subunit n=1 Tax=Cronobacter sakazakii TaxID=28141 RepID=UPI0011E4A174|nr:DmsC/YnfH family molybdoenzyme membrane anchor subunit [Cronobacter sakazakii]MDT3609047.1 DmsC/YnfH family molybdoenzyme membrane anchor subunit [Cronobacter sakazakii]TYD51374.1 dimethylsulfoxide reductase [Cronobacter sakazakii]
MGSGWHEWPLVLFTVLGQCVVGGLIITGLAWLTGTENERPRIVRAMFFLWVLMGIAFLASVMHLGSPLRAFNSLNRLGHSPLSNEIASGSLFFAVGGLWWLVAVLGKMPDALGKIWLIVAMALGVLFIFAMTRVYQINTVPTWHNGYTTLGFFLTAFLGGPLLGALLLAVAGVAGPREFAMVSVFALVISVAAALMQSAGLAGIHSSVQQASALLPDYGFWQAWRMVLLALGIGCWLCPLARRVPPRPWGLAAGFALVLAGELIGRGLFYGLHMTVGMAVAG